MPSKTFKHWHKHLLQLVVMTARDALPLGSLNVCSFQDTGVTSITGRNLNFPVPIMGSQFDSNVWAASDSRGVARSGEWALWNSRRFWFRHGARTSFSWFGQAEGENHHENQYSNDTPVLGVVVGPNEESPCVFGVASPVSFLSHQVDTTNGVLKYIIKHIAETVSGSRR